MSATNSFNGDIYTDISQIPEKIDDFKRHIDGLGGERIAGICGFDGFIDTFIRLQNPATMAEFGPKVSEAAGISASYPVHHLGDKFGGNGPLFAVALHDVLSGNVDISYIGALGKGTVLPIFQEALAGKVQCIHTLAEPAHSDCLEFNDGKIMLSDMRSCADVTWERLMEYVGEKALDAMLMRSRFVAAVNWGKLVNVGGIWENMARRMGELGIPKKEVVFFMDLAEFEQRPREDRLGLVELVSKITAQCQTLLSLNLKEAWQMADEFGGDFHGRKAPGEIGEVAAFIRKHIDADRILVHPNDGAACASDTGCIYIPGPYCKQPLISTGAGDNFGAGCLAGVLSSMDDLDLLLSGVCASGHFVRSGKSASYQEIGHLASLWCEGRLPERL
jgi:hypothetical protein